MLMYRCSTCGGDGLVEAGWNPVHGEPGILMCGECEGRGYLTTTDGKELLSFLEKFGFAPVPEEDPEDIREEEGALPGQALPLEASADLGEAVQALLAQQLGLDCRPALEDTDRGQLNAIIEDLRVVSQTAERIAAERRGA